MTSAVPAAPRGLSAESRRLWRAILADWGLSDAERSRLEQGLRHLDRAAQLDEAVAREGVTTVDRFGQARVHPGLSEARKLRTDAARILASLSLDEPDQVPVRRGAKPGPRPQVRGLRGVS